MEFKMKNFDSKSELEEIYSREIRPKIFIESEDASLNQYKLINASFVTIGLIDHSFGVPIQLEEVKKYRILIGHENEILCVCAKLLIILWRVRLDSVFFQFKKIEEKKIFVVFEEIGVHVIDFNGNKIWSFYTDIITDFNVANSVIKIKTFDDLEMKIDVETGKCLNL